MTEATVEQFSRPAIISNAVKLLYATLGIGVLQAVLEFQTLVQQMPVIFILFGWAVAFAVGWFLIHKIGSGRNWARITLLILFIAGVPFSVLPLLQSLSATPVSGLMGVLEMVGQVVALVMLFQGTSNAWFRKLKAAREKLNVQLCLQGEIAYAGFWRRLIAFFIDLVILYLIFFAIPVIFGEIGSAFIIFVPLVYGCLLEGSKWNATLGKKLLSIAVKNLNGKSVSYGKALGRNLLKYLLFIIVFLVYLCGVKIFGPFKPQSYEGISSVVMRSTLLNLIIVAIFCLWMFGPRIISIKRQSLHDILTGSVVIRKQKNVA